MNIDPKILARAQAEQSAPSDADLARVQKAISEARALEMQKVGLEEQLSEVNKQLNTLYFVSLPDLFNELGFSSFTLNADGNYPAMEAQARPYYSANISARWPEEKRREAFDYLKSIGHDDIIKTQITIALPARRKNKREANRAERVLKVLAKIGIIPEVKQDVNHNTLTAWLKERVEQENFVPDLSKIGGTVGRIVRLKEKNS